MLEPLHLERQVVVVDRARLGVRSGQDDEDAAHVFGGGSHSAYLGIHRLSTYRLGLQGLSTSEHLRSDHTGSHEFETIAAGVCLLHWTIPSCTNGQDHAWADRSSLEGNRVPAARAIQTLARLVHPSPVRYGMR